MTCDVDIEACEREVTKLTIVIEEDAVNGMVKGWDEEVEGPGVKPCGHESWRWDSNDWEREMDEEEEEEVEKRIENTGLKKWEGD